MGYLFLWLLMGLITAFIAQSKGRSGCLFFLLGFLLGPIGIIIALIMPGSPPPRKLKKCPSCGAMIPEDALKCPRCGHDFTDLKNIPEAEVIDDE